MGMSLWEVCSLGKVDEARALLKLRFRVNKGIDVNRRNADNETVLMYVAGRCSHISILRLLLEQPPIEVNLADNMGSTALHVATFARNIEAVRLLLADPRVNVNSQDAHEETALMVAAGLDTSETQVSVLRLLLEHPSIKVNLADDEGYTALHRASRGIIRFEAERKPVK